MTPSLAPDVSVTETEDGMVLLHERTGRYWMLNATGATVVRHLREGASVQDAIESLCARFPRERQRVEADVRRLLEQLSKARLVTP
ncbi:lasso peptide biosynthesis PqqD family chaperone [Streptomyces sp. NPDC046261]|uniref:lasso peptide biosynthesis PqqD family chaperone n=1 Tax=Streptomyces sp. NPDC046261 TaxID=3157200 RepID=UPI003407F0E3